MATGTTDELARAADASEAELEHLLSADEILAVDDTRYERVPVPEWKGTVRIRSLSAEEVQEYVESIDGPAKRNAMVMMMMRSAVDKDGRQLFGDPKVLGALKKKSMSAYVRLQDKILELNGLSDKAKAAAKNA